MKSLRNLLLASVASASLLLVAGCGGGGNQSDTGAESESSGGSETSASSDEATTITFWSWNPDATTVLPYKEAFEADNPDIKVDFRFIQYSDYVNTTQLALQSGSGPDVFGLQVGALTTQFEPLAEDLAPIMEEKLGADWRDQLTSTFHG